MKIAIVTGASSGMGKEFVRQIERFYRELDEIWVIARSEKKLEEIKKSHKTYIRIFAGDMEEDLVYKQVKNRLENQNPDIRMLVNAAGFGKTGTVEEIAKEDKKLQLRMIDLNCRAAAALTAAVLPYMGRGSRVLEICSSAAFQPLPGFNVYAATKAFLLRYSRALRWEAAPRGIRVTAVCPGWIRTDFMDVARDTKNGRTVRSFPFAQRPETVARRALRNSRLLAVTTCGLPALVQRVASKFLPHCLIMACWEGLRRA